MRNAVVLLTGLAASGSGWRERLRRGARHQPHGPHRWVQRDRYGFVRLRAWRRARDTVETKLRCSLLREATAHFLSPRRQMVVSS